uniref:Uncharacterized protein n=1 Tax=Globodera rostochiensis TaxID=31243 RepID=A0A914IG87_GLORO
MNISSAELFLGWTLSNSPTTVCRAGSSIPSAYSRYSSSSSCFSSPLGSLFVFVFVVASGGLTAVSSVLLLAPDGLSARRPFGCPASGPAHWGTENCAPAVFGELRTEDCAPWRIAHQQKKEENCALKIAHYHRELRNTVRNSPLLFFLLVRNSPRLLERRVHYSESRASSHLSLNTTCMTGPGFDFDSATLEEVLVEAPEQLAALYDLAASSPVGTFSLTRQPPEAPTSWHCPCASFAVGDVSETACSRQTEGPVANCLTLTQIMSPQLSMPLPLNCENKQIRDLITCLRKRKTTTNAVNIIGGVNWRRF